MIASTSMSDATLKILLLIADMDMVLMTAMAIASVMAKMVWLTLNVAMAKNSQIA